MSAVILALLSVARAAPIPADIVAALQARVDQGFDTASVIAIRGPDGDEIMAFGAATPESELEYGSITKTFTSALLAERVVAGELSLDTTIGELLPAEPAIPDAVRQITLAELASHTSGLAHMPCDLETDGMQPYRAYGREDLLQSLATCRPDRAPGKRSKYSNFGAALLGELLAREAGGAWADLVRERLLVPLDLTDIGYPAIHPDRLVPATIDGVVVPHWEFAALAGTGALRGTAADLLEWTSAAAIPSDGPLEAAFALQRTPRDQTRTFWLIGRKAYFNRVGLAWHLTELDDDRTVIWHNGGTQGFRSFAGSVDGRTVVVLAASGRSVDSIGFHALLPEAEMDPVPERTRLPVETLAGFGGRYELSSGQTVEVDQGAGHLTVRVDGSAPYGAWPDGPDRFELDVTRAKLRFKRDPDGVVDALALTTPLSRGRARRVGPAPGL